MKDTIGRKGSLISLFLLVLICGNAFSLQSSAKNNQQRTLVFDNLCTYTLTMPINWWWDDSNYLHGSRNAIFFRRGYDKRQLSITTEVDAKHVDTLSAFISKDISQYQDMHSMTSPFDSIRINSALSVPVRFLTTRKGQQFMAIAYIRCEYGILKILLHSKGAKRFRRMINEWREFVSSYKKEVLIQLEGGPE